MPLMARRIPGMSAAGREKSGKSIFAAETKEVAAFGENRYNIS
jgi:hypothetical protein